MLEHFRRAATLVAGACAAALMTAGCSLNTTSTTTATPASPTTISPTDANKPLERATSVKVAILLPLTATPVTVEIAKALKQAGELALLEFDNPNVLLIAKDTKGTPEGARLAAEEAVAAGAELIIGPLFAKEALSVAPVARRANVPLLSFSSDPSVAGNGTFLMSFVAGEDVSRIVTHAASNGMRTFAALIPDNAYGKIAESNFRDAVTRTGGKVAIVQRFPLDATGMTEPVKRIKTALDAAAAQGAPIDALFIPAGPESLDLLAPMLTYHNIDASKVKLIGTASWDYPNLIRERSMHGGWFPAPDPKGWNEFVQRYTAAYGTAPPRIASLSYDAVSMAIALSNGPKGQRYTPATLTRTSGFAGIDGIVRLRQNGTSERGFAILEVQKQSAVVVDAAPRVFGEPNVTANDASTNKSVAFPQLNVFSAPQ